MSDFVALDPNFEARVRASFLKQKIMETIGARLTRLEAGEVDIELPFRDDLTQQNGYLHAAVVTAIADSACGYAAYTLMPETSGVLTIEYKVNFVSPAKGERMIARARVVRPGRSVTVCAGDVFAASGGREKLIATMLATMMMVPGPADPTGTENR